MHEMQQLGYKETYQNKRCNCIQQLFLLTDFFSQQSGCYPYSQLDFMHLFYYLESLQSLKKGQNKWGEEKKKNLFPRSTAKFWTSVSVPWRQAVVFLVLQKQLRNVWNTRHDWTTSMQLHAVFSSLSFPIQNRRPLAELRGRWSMPGKVQTSPVPWHKLNKELANPQSWVASTSQSFLLLFQMD